MASWQPAPVPARGAPRQSSSTGRCWPTGAYQVDSASERIKLGARPGQGGRETDRPTTGAQHIGGVDAVAASQRGGDQRQQLVPRVGPPRRAAEVEVTVDEFPQAQVLGEGGRQEQAGIGHQAVVVKGGADTVGIVLWQHLLGAPCFRAGFCSKTIIPDSEEHLFALSGGLSHALVRWIGA